MMSNEGEMRCPLCAEEMDWTDQQLKPCKCGYQVCVWCWHQIMDMAEKDETEGRCPACWSPYDKDKIVGTETKFERVVANNANRRHKPPKAKAKTNEVRKDLTNIRVIQRRMAYVIGLPLSLANEDLLQQKEFFGQYGKLSKVSLSRTAGGAIQQFVNDTCSVYITFSKEEEAIRCIQSVHGFVLEGRFLRASFGTAKYCHAWLRNMPCNNSACLYLHSIGAEEDSFSKDEVAAVQTRSRVQQIVGATHNLHRCSGNVLPPPIDEHYSYSSASADKPVFKSFLKDIALDTATLNGHSAYLPSSEDKDGGARVPNKITAFVDIVGRPCIYGPEKDGSVAEDGTNLNLSSELSLVGIQKDNFVEAAITDAMPCRNFSSSSLLANRLSTNKEFQEPFREHSNLWCVGRADVTASDEFMKEQSVLILGSGGQIQRGLCSVVRDDFIAFGDGRLNDSGSPSPTASLLPPSYPLKALEDSRNYVWQHGETRNLSDYNVGLNTVNNNVDLASVTNAHSVNEGYNDKKFQSSAKSDRIYRCSNSFSNEEIVEHLRRLDDHDGTKDAQNPALESSIISNIMSLDLDGGDDSSILSPGVTGLFDHTDRGYGSSWNLYNNDQSVFSFTKQQGFDHQLSDLDSFSDIGQDLKKFSAHQNSGENKDHYSCKPQYLVSRARGLSPTGFSLPSREPPPGFPACERTDQGFNANSGGRMVKTSFTKNHYRTLSTGNSSNTSDVDIIDPAIMVVGRSKPPNGLTNSCFDTRPTYASQPGIFDDEARLWLLMQQSAPAHQNLKYPQSYTQQALAARQEQRYSGQIGNGYSSWDDMYGVSSRHVDQLQTYNPSSCTPFLQQKVANGKFSNRYQPGLDEMQLRNEMGMAELQRNEKLGFSNFYSGYGDYVLQPGSGDLYTRVFGM